MSDTGDSDGPRGPGPQTAPDTVDPMIRARILSLVSALGGPSPAGAGYALGDEALACLKDLRRWLRLYDEKLNRYDVARCISEANLVRGDLLEILAALDTSGRANHRIALAALELLVPLTWPLDRAPDAMTANHHRHAPALLHAQAGYKAAILRHPGRILATIARLALPSMALPAAERPERDEGVIKLALYFFRNIALIEHPSDSADDDISRSATVAAFADQNILHLLLTVASGIAAEFPLLDTVLLEVLYALLKSADIDALFRTPEQEGRGAARSLASLLRAEDERKRAGSSAGTRHNRFGTTVWMEKSDGRRAFVSGQSALLGTTTALKKLDAAKKWRKPSSDPRGVGRKTEYDIALQLEAAARARMRAFVEDFLDAGFSPLFALLRRAIERDAERMLESNRCQFFYLVAWFLKAERVRRKAPPLPTPNEGGGGDDGAGDAFSHIAAVLNQETLVTLTRRMADWFDSRSWHALHSTMRAFTQILLTVQDMAASGLEEDREIAENILARVFYEEATLDLCVGVLRAYTKQSFAWLDDATEMVCVLVRMLERYVDGRGGVLFVRSKRGRRRKAKTAKSKTGAEGEEEEEEEEEDQAQDEEEEEEEARATANERAFSFTLFETKLLNAACIAPFLSLLDHYLTLSPTQLKRALTFFHRVFVKRREEVLLFRLDIVERFYRIMQDPHEALPRTSPVWAEMDTFVRYYLRRFGRKMQERPEMVVEVLFSKMQGSVRFLTVGYEEESVKAARPPAELHIPGHPHEQQVGIAVGVLLDENMGDAVDWLKGVFSKAASERAAWEAEGTARRILEEEAAADAGAELIQSEFQPPPRIVIKPDSEQRGKAMSRDPKLRLLLSTLGLEEQQQDGDDGTQWGFPPALMAEGIREELQLLKRYTDDPITLDDGRLPADAVKRKQKRRVFDSDSDGGEDGEMMFEPGGPTAMKALGGEKPRKKPARRRRRKDAEEEGEEGDGDDDGDDARAREKREKRKEKERERMKAVKSDLYVHDSDDESDPEKEVLFLLKEQAQREKGVVPAEDGATAGRKRKKRAKKETTAGVKKRRPVRESEDEDVVVAVVVPEEDDEDEPVMSRDATPVVPAAVDLTSEGEESEGPYTLGPVRSSDVVMNDAEDEEEEDVAPRPGRRRGPAVVDSDSE